MPKRIVYPWQAWEKNLLRKLSKKGENATEMSEQLDRTPIAIQRKAREIGIRTGTSRSYAIAHRQRAIVLDCIYKHPGITIPRLARLVRRHERTVRRMMARLKKEGFVINNGGNARNTRFGVTSLWKDERCRYAGS